MSLVDLINKNAQIQDVFSLVDLIDGSLDGYVKLFLLACRANNLSPVSIKDYSHALNAFVGFCKRRGINAPASVDINCVRLYVFDLQQRCKARSVRDYYGVIHKFFNWLVEEEAIKQSPMLKLHPPRFPKQIIQPFKSDQINRLLALCDNSFLGLRNRAIILTFLDSGLRLAELAGIQMGDMDLERGVIRVMGKGAKERLVRVGKKGQGAILKYLLQRHDNFSCLWVTEERRPLRAEGIQAMVNRLGKRAGIANVRCSPHTFRHTFGPWMLEHGADIRTVQSLLGHSTLTMTLRYVETVSSEQAIERHKEFSPVDNRL